MRNKARIPIFLTKVDNEILIKNIWKLPIKDAYLEKVLKTIEDNIHDIVTYWEENPDLRYSQVLVNLGVIPNVAGTWYYMEENEILVELDVPKREFLLWGQNFDKDMNRLPETIFRPIKDLNTDHIEAILSGDWVKNSVYKQVCEEELELRKGNK